MEENKNEKKEKQELQTWSHIGFFGDVMGGIISWSLLTNLPVLIFFYPCVKMGFTGWEIFFVSYMITGILGHRGLKNFAASKPYLFRLLSIIGLISFHFEDHSYRLGAGGMAVLFDQIGFNAIWIQSIPERRIRGVFGYLLGMIAYASLRMFWFSVDPIDSNIYYNYAAIAMAVIVALLQFIEGPKIDPSKIVSTKGNNTPSYWRVAVGIGGLYFLTHWLFAEHGIVSRWTEVPTFPHGAIVLLSFSIGILLSQNSFVRSLQWFIFGITAAAIFGGSNNTLPPIVQFIGGIFLAVYCGSIWIVAIDQLAECNKPGSALFIGNGLLVALHMWSVYVVAYKFMDPVLGVLLRERNVLLLFVTVGCCFFVHVKNQQSINLKRIPSIAKVFWFIVILLTLTPASLFRFYHSMDTPKVDPATAPIRTLVWAVHFGYDNNGRVNILSLASTIEQQQATVVGLVESDCSRTWIGNRDLVEYIGETLHYHTDFGSSTAQNTWGCALLSLFPIERSERIILPSPEGELACLIDADIRVNGTLVNVIVSHFGNTEDELDRELQKEGLKQLLARKKGVFSPTIFAGYLTTNVMSPHYLEIMSPRMQDTTNSFDRYCLYIIFRDLLQRNFIRVDKSYISDTEAQVATFTLSPGTLPTVPGTKDQCRPIGNDHVKCAAQGNCGLCVFAPTRYCYEPELESGCKSINGTWLGKSFASDATTISKEAAAKFYEAQFEQQSKDTSFLTKVDKNSYYWTLNNFYETWALFTQFNSPIFEAKGYYWQISLTNIRGPFSPQNERSLWLGVEPKNNFNETISVTYELSILHGDPAKSVKRQISEAKFSPETEAIGAHIIKVSDLFNGFYNGSLKIKVTISNVEQV